MAEEHVFTDIKGWYSPDTQSYQVTAKLTGSGTKVGASITDEFVQDMPPDYIKHTIVEALAGVVYVQAKKDIEDSLAANSDFLQKWQSVGYANGGFVFEVEKKVADSFGLPHTFTAFEFANAFTSASQSNHLSSPTALKNKLKDVEKEVTCPAKDCTIGTNDSAFHHTVWQMVQHLNDRHKWKREDIADWLDTLDLDLTIGEKS